MHSLAPDPDPDIQVPSPKRADAFTVRSDASVRDSVRILAAVVTQMNERIELLEARELLNRPR